MPDRWSQRTKNSVLLSIAAHCVLAPRDLTTHRVTPTATPINAKAAAIGYKTDAKHSARPHDVTLARREGHHRTYSADTIEAFALGLVARPDGYSEFHQVATGEHTHSGGYEIQGRIASINRAGYSSPTIEGKEIFR